MSSKQQARLEKTHEKKEVVGFAVSTMLLCSLLFSVDAQQPKKVSRIGYLSTSIRLLIPPVPRQFDLALRERGYIEGQNIAIEYRYAEGKRQSGS